MNDVVKEWMSKAEGDFATASREMQAQDPNYDAVCFHAQQCIDKLIKGFLITLKVTPPKTHDLVVLDKLLKSASHDWQWPIEELRLLTQAAVVFRYPGESADVEEAGAALDVCTRLRTQLQALLQYQ